jgi:hypothetical protein
MPNSPLETVLVRQLVVFRKSDGCDSFVVEHLPSNTVALTNALHVLDTMSTSPEVSYGVASRRSVLRLSLRYSFAVWAASTGINKPRMTLIGMKDTFGVHRC